MHFHHPVHNISANKLRSEAEASGAERNRDEVSTGSQKATSQGNLRAPRLGIGYTSREPANSRLIQAKPQLIHECLALRRDFEYGESFNQTGIPSFLFPDEGHVLGWQSGRPRLGIEGSHPLGF
eukprot:Protomagalhaensia_sp_Gyna_25__1565@NODE_1804_length_1522_cov_79_174646_g1481_i0_p2_GENE_NODE_1804_length_1522_cov_79_174646_g1481_i0NODE_1804_length_1522_cov_79_174646_g1481_i0_p2_ORF_typecomplete_len124_score9_34_NODE_1804_length_1522_cov_79_174646_g1481_i0250621